MIPVKDISMMVAASLMEDVGDGDITAELIDPNVPATAVIITREPAVVCGIPWVEETYRQLDPAVEIQWQVVDGSRIEANQILGAVIGPARSIVTGERCALNWLQTLSGTATLTAQYATEIQGTVARLYDTRKTIPGLRTAQKYAVRMGGGENHRMGLFDAFLIKENHIMGIGSVAEAIRHARELHPDKLIEIEVENLVELEQAIAAQADIVLLDNFDIAGIRQAVAINKSQTQLEVSGNIDLSNIREIAKTGVNRISVGALTKHILSVDLSLRFKE